VKQEFKTIQHADDADLRNADERGSRQILFCLIRVDPRLEDPRHPRAGFPFSQAV
jgi:hypothetical protein